MAQNRSLQDGGSDVMGSIQRAWDGLWSPKASPQGSPKMESSQPPRPHWTDNPTVAYERPVTEYAGTRYVDVRSQEDSPYVEVQGPARRAEEYYSEPSLRTAEKTSPYRRRPGVEYLEPRYVEGRQVDYDPRYDLYQADRRSAPVERRVVEPHEMRILGENVLSQTTSEFATSPMQGLSVPTSRTDYRAVDRERIPTPQRVRQSPTSGQPRSSSPMVVREHDHTMYPREVQMSPLQQAVQRSLPQQVVRAAPPTPPQVIERVVEVPVDRVVEKIVEVPKIVEKVVTVEVPVEKIVEKQVIEYRDRVVEKEKIVEKPVIEYRDRVVETERVVEVPVEVEKIVHVNVPGPERVVEKVVTVEVEKPVIQKSVMQVQQRSSPQQIRAENPEIVYAPPLVVRQEQPARAYRGDWTEVDELRRQVSREELHSHADQIYHSMSKVAIGVAHGEYATQAEYNRSPPSVHMGIGTAMQPQSTMQYHAASPPQSYQSVQYSPTSFQAYPSATMGVSSSPYAAPLSPRFNRTSPPLRPSGSPLRSSDEGYWNQGSWIDAPHNGYFSVVAGTASPAAVSRSTFTVAMPWNEDYH